MLNVPRVSESLAEPGADTLATLLSGVKAVCVLRKALK